MAEGPAMSADKVPEREPQVMEELGKLSDALEALERDTASLEERLTRVLRAHEPGSETVIVAAVTERVQVAEMVYMATRTVWALQDRIHRLKDRLEV